MSYDRRQRSDRAGHRPLVGAPDALTPTVGKTTLVAQLENSAGPPVQRRAGGVHADDTTQVHAAAARGIATPTTALPHAEAIQSAFGPAHDVSRIKAHVGGNAADAMGATAFASGDHVVFDQRPDLHTAAHEVAHVVQQAHGVDLHGGVGRVGDAYERHADQVADRVVAGQSAADLLGAPTRSAKADGAVQMDKKKVSDATAKEQSEQHDKAEGSSNQAVASAIALGAVHVGNAAVTIDNVIHTKDDDGGPGRQAKICKDWFGRVQSEIRRLRQDVAAQKLRFLAPEIKRLNGAYDRFGEAWARARVYLARYNETLTSNVESLELIALNEACNIDHKDMNMHDRSVDERKDEVLLKEAIDNNSEAVIQTAHSVRMGMDIGKDATLEQDLKMLIQHVGEIWAQFRPGENQRLTAKSYDKAKLTKAIAECQALQKEISARPHLSDILAKSQEFSYTFTMIKNQAGVK
jgi:hypothetical protein